MSIKCKDIANYIEEFAPVHLAEDWDNVGLLVGSFNQEIKRVMVCLDVTTRVMEQAVCQKVDMIISHHPLIFKPLKRLNADEFKGKILYSLVKNNISLYSAHTNLDAGDNGINEVLAEKLGLSDIQNLNNYKSEALYKLVVFVPKDNLDKVRNAMCEAGAGWIGNYSDCTFSTEGTGTFRPLEGTNPYIGSQGTLEKVEEFKIETVVPSNKLKNVLNAMLAAHPYEEAAYDIYRLDRHAKEYGLGKIGLLKESQKLEDFISFVKKQLSIDKVRLIGSLERDVKKVAVFCGAFDGDWSGVLSKGADVLITGDVKYHDAADAVAMGLCVIDAGHFNTERIIVPRLEELLMKRFPDLEIVRNTMEKDPINIC